jgi:hypothetical protein
MPHVIEEFNFTLGRRRSQYHYYTAREACAIILRNLSSVRMGLDCCEFIRLIHLLVKNANFPGKIL